MFLRPIVVLIKHSILLEMYMNRSIPELLFSLHLFSRWSRISYRCRRMMQVLLVQVALLITSRPRNLRRTREYISDKSTGYFEREYKNLREHPDEFKDLTRMSPDLFDRILEQIGDRLTKHCLRVPIGAEERLFVTLV